MSSIASSITEKKEENLRKVAELYQQMDDMHRGMLIGWACALKARLPEGGQDEKSA